MAENTSADTDDLVLAWQRGDGSGRVEFVVTSTHVDELLALLADRDVSATLNPRQVRGGGADVLTIVVAVAESPAAWGAIGLAVKTFFDRHKGKRIRIDENGLTEAASYSARDIERIIRALSGTEPDDVDGRR